MNKLTQLDGIAIALRNVNIDTDAIIPSREMKRVSKVGLGEGLFAGWRYLSPDSRQANMDFILNKPQAAKANVLLAGTNFGCGSSREHAVWALMDYGFKAIIAPSFGSIFQSNCYRNGLLAISLSDEIVQLLVEKTQKDPAANPVHIDLQKQQVTSPNGDVYEFSIPADARERLLAGADEIDLTYAYTNEINEFRERRYHQAPWVSLLSEYECSKPITTQDS